MRIATRLAALVLLALAVAAAGAAEVLRVRVSDFAPLYFQQGERWIGLDVELAEAARRADQPIGIQQDAKYSPALDDRLAHDPAFKGLAIHPFQLEPSPVYLGLSKALSERASERIEAAFRRLEANGTLGHIRAKWEDMGER
jgi:ABC-type amino acid transport substrate-binding protein